MKGKTIETHKTGCIVCGLPLQYFDAAKTLKCEFCGKCFEANCTCEKGHYICDKCHAQDAFEFIMAYTLQTVGKCPATMATEIMNNRQINMHGPEHHFLVAAVLLAAYKNCGGDIDLKLCLQKALQRAKSVPGGICGAWGSCGAAIASGIFVSVATGATPLSEKEWSLANSMTSQSLAYIAQNGGPRCCKRNTYLTIETAVEFVRKHFGIEMEQNNNIECGFFDMNNQCKKSACQFYPQSTAPKL